MRKLSRRSVLLTGLAGLAGVGGVCGLAEADVIPGRHRLAPYLGECGETPALPRVQPGSVYEAWFTAASQSGTARAVIGLPPGDAEGLPVVVLLHGSGENARTPFDVHGVHYYLADAVKRGTPPFALVSIDQWSTPAGMPSPILQSDLLPFLARRGMPVGRFGVLGWSRGGRGALWFAASSAPGRIAAVAAVSPALSRSDLTPLSTNLAGIPASLTCGRDDAFADSTRDLLARLRATRRADVSGGITPGCHDAAFRRRMLPAQLSFVGRHLAE